MRLVRGTWSALCGFVAVVGYCRAASAQAPAPARFGFDYQAEPELACPSAPELQSAVSRQLGYDPFVAGDGTPQHGVRVALAKAGAGLEARIDWVDASGQSEGGRRLVSETADCAELARGVAFAVAVQIQLRAPTPPAPEKPPAAPPPRPAPPVAEPVRVPRERRPESERLFLVGLGADLQRGWAPGTSPGLELLGAVGLGRGWLEAGVGGTLSTTHALSDGTSVEAHTLNGWLSPCIRTAPVAWCATGRVGRLAVRGRGIDHPLSPSSTLAAVGGRIEVLWPALRSAGVLIHAEVLGTLTPRDVILNQAPAWSTAPVYFCAGIDLAWIFK